MGLLRKKSNVEQLGDTFTEGLGSVRESLDNPDRTVSAILLAGYPDRASIGRAISVALTGLAVEAMQVQAMIKGKQITIVSRPGDDLDIAISDEDSLCSLSVGADETMWIENLQDNGFAKGHPAVSRWTAWCAAPVHVHDQAAGTVCALDTTQREWSEKDKTTLEYLAKQIGALVETWSDEGIG